MPDWMGAVEVCIACRYFEIDDERDDIGVCRRYPRTYHPQGGWVLAVHKAEDWCGEFKPDRLELN